MVLEAAFILRQIGNIGSREVNKPVRTEISRHVACDYHDLKSTAI